MDVGQRVARFPLAQERSEHVGCRDAPQRSMKLVRCYKALAFFSGGEGVEYAQSDLRLYMIKERSPPKEGRCKKWSCMALSCC